MLEYRDELDIVFAVRLGKGAMDQPVRGCGKLLRRAMDAGLVVRGKDGRLRLTAKGKEAAGGRGG